MPSCSFTAGETTAKEKVGGQINITAGLGSNENGNNGGDGGKIFVTGGEGRGTNSFDVGGDITLTGGKATGGSGGSYYNIPGGDGGSGQIVVLEMEALTTSTSMTLISDTFTASSTPTTARIVVFAELPDGLSDFSFSATRDNTTFNAITLTDTGYISGSSGTKIYTGSTPLTGTASPQVQLRWKIVGSSLASENKIHGVSLQWA